MLPKLLPTPGRLRVTAERRERVHRMSGNNAGNHTYSAEIAALVAEGVRRHHAVVEQACEVALAGGLYGVMVEWNAEMTRAWVDPDVPYGTIHERFLPPTEAHS